MFGATLAAHNSQATQTQATRGNFSAKGTYGKATDVRVGNFEGHSSIY
ncbi:MAG: hypothetical protein H6R41_1027, partial [Deltaproteobacteria bacterium]|nr:hypothetical protein [Deltaproteobacteria bacterium]